MSDVMESLLRDVLVTFASEAQAQRMADALMERMRQEGVLPGPVKRCTSKHSDGRTVVLCTRPEGHEAHTSRYRNWMSGDDDELLTSLSPLGRRLLRLEERCSMLADFLVAKGFDPAELRADG